MTAFFLKFISMYDSRLSKLRRLITTETLVASVLVFLVCFFFKCKLSRLSVYLPVEGQ